MDKKDEPSKNPLLDDAKIDEKPHEDTSKSEDKVEVTVESVEDTVPTETISEAAVTKEDSGIRITIQELRKYTLYTLGIGVLITGLIAIVAVLIGGFDTYTWRAIGTVLNMVIHTVLVLAFLSWLSAGGRQPVIVIYTLILSLLISFLTSVLAIWDIMSGDIVGKVYSILVWTFLLSCVWQGMQWLHRQDKLVRATAYATDVAASVVYFMILPIVISGSSYKMPEAYLRILTALSILTGMLAVIASIANKLYVSKHPELKTKMSTHNKVVAIILAVLAAPFVIAFIVGVIISTTNLS